MDKSLCAINLLWITSAMVFGVACGKERAEKVHRPGRTTVAARTPRATTGAPCGPSSQPATSRQTFNLAATSRPAEPLLGQVPFRLGMSYDQVVECLGDPNRRIQGTYMFEYDLTPIGLITMVFDESLRLKWARWWYVSAGGWGLFIGDYNGPRCRLAKGGVEYLRVTDEPRRAEDLRKLRLGMTSGEVVGAIGPPNRARPEYSSCSVDAYDIFPEGDVVLTFDGVDGKLRGIMGWYRNRDGKVVTVNEGEGVRSDSDPRIGKSSE